MLYLKVHLKVCEGCGGLWFRTEDRGDVYCSSCAGRLKGYPRMVTRRRGRPCKKPIPAAPANGGAR
jgi:hypothetical protein